MKINKRFAQLGIATDQWVGCVVGLFMEKGHWADETISARAFRESKTNKRWGRLKRVIDTIFFWDKAHCQNAYISEQTRQQLAPEYRTDESGG